MADINYCRREIDEKFCMNPISVKNPLDWCDDCRSRLPLWPTDVQPAAQLQEVA